jgi:serine phosphatase RsbU (regulator of sigma subunit)
LHLRSVYILVYIGFLGVILFLLLRPSIDFYSGGPIESSRVLAEETGFEILSNLGFETDSLMSLTKRVQRNELFTELRDSIGRSATYNPAVLNTNGFPLHGWSLMIGHKFDRVEGVVSDNALYEDVGSSYIMLDNRLRVRSIRFIDSKNEAFVEGESESESLLQTLKIMGYNPEYYAFKNPAENVLILDESGVLSVKSDDLNNPLDVVTQIKFHRTSTQYRGPESISITYTPTTSVIESDSLATFRNGIKIDRVFASHHQYDVDKQPEQSITTLDIAVIIVSIAFLSLLVIIVGVRQIFRGEVIWKRGVLLIVALTLGAAGWRFLTFVESYYRFLSVEMQYLDMFMMLLSSGIMAILITLAYIAWEAIARKQEQEEIPLIDALWAGNIFQKKLGKSILASYGYAGVALAMWSIALYALDLVYFQRDSQMGFMEASSIYPALSTIINSWLTTWFIAIAIIAFITSLLKVYIKQTATLILLASLLSGLLIATVSPFVSTNGSMLHDIFVMWMLSIPLVLAFHYYGIVTVATSVWLLFMMVRLSVYMGSADLSIALNGWLLTIATLTPFVFGFMMHRFGRDDLRSTKFVPEYESRIIKQLRLEREFQIAKESQFALMPKSSPDIEGVDVRGFFIPSFDVGGDFYDHVVVRDEQGNATELVVTVVDVSGKAMQAALTAIFTSGLILSRVRTKDKDPALVLSDINKVLHQRIEKQTFVTCLLARYDLTSNEITFVNAGHCMPVLKRDGKARFLKSGNTKLPLGVRSKVDYESTTKKLETGDVLLFYSDGLPEARSNSGTFYEFDTILEKLEVLDTENMDASSICEYFKQEILTFSDYELADDMTLVVMKL